MGLTGKAITKSFSTRLVFVPFGKMVLQKISFVILINIVSGSVLLHVPRLCRVIRQASPESQNISTFQSFNWWQSITDDKYLAADETNIQAGGRPTCLAEDGPLPRVSDRSLISNYWHMWSLMKIRVVVVTILLVKVIVVAMMIMAILFRDYTGNWKPMKICLPETGNTNYRYDFPGWPRHRSASAQSSPPSWGAGGPSWRHLLFRALSSPGRHIVLIVTFVMRSASVHLVRLSWLSQVEQRGNC